MTATRDAILAAGFAVVSTDLVWRPAERTPLTTLAAAGDDDDAVLSRDFAALLDALDEHPDVSVVFHDAV